MIRGEYLAGSRPLFVLLHRPPRPARACVLVVPPFAEEMNKSRRLLTVLAEKLGRADVAVAIPDLYGTGDSGGDFVDATWAGWLADLDRSRVWLESQQLPVTAVLAIRLGAALALNAIAIGALRPVRHSVFCQPIFDGQRTLQQFLRLRVAASLGLGSRETIESLRGRLASGDTVEVAGYVLSPAFAAELEEVLPPNCLPAELGGIDWIELVRAADATLPATTLDLVERSRGAGAIVRTHAVIGEPFWGTAEIVADPRVVGVLRDCLVSAAAYATKQGI